MKKLLAALIFAGFGIVIAQDAPQPPPEKPEGPRNEQGGRPGRPGRTWAHAGGVRTLFVLCLRFAG